MQDALQQSLQFLVSDLPPTLIESCRKEVLKAADFGKRVAVLIAAWFTLLFAIELFLRVILGSLSLLNWMAFGSRAAESREELKPADETEKSTKITSEPELVVDMS